MGGIVSKIIMHYLKEFLEPASTQQMKLKIFKGSLVLNNIELKSTALTSQLIPFIVRKGTIGYIDVSFPWKKLNKNPTIITIRDVFVVLQFDGRILLKKDMQASRDALHVEQEQTSPVAEKQSFIQGIFETIIDNVRINIENIHICVEIPIEETTISIGLVIKKINLSTLDENDKVITSIVHPKSVHKGLTITGLAAYFDTFSDQIPIDLFQQTMKDQITGEHQFLLSPTDISTILIHSHDPQDKYTNQLSVNIPKIKLGLDFHQCRALVSLSSMVRKLQNSRRYASCNRPKSFENCSKIVYLQVQKRI
ncbi:vacuolar associated sorting protein [Histomonas meleagridis]|uniref:vacuolar associated sorting protein n=1 Tax=Histomonas meleagridis TaxID=135588 RepID=UPI003559AF67|nr:vacuolar associated sorting protein [Histomonas meleagridis]KAH0806658.1 vacuolar associated sorting protein [Histomonas meleagridis]